MEVTVTSRYTATWRAFRAVAGRHSLNPFDVRVLVALADWPIVAPVTEQKLADQLGIARPAVRRSARVLADRYLLTRATHGVKSVTLVLGTGGIAVAREVLEEVRGW